jgi:hypothetical protein
MSKRSLTSSIELTNGFDGDLNKPACMVRSGSDGRTGGSNGVKGIHACTWFLTEHTYSILDKNKRIGD